MKNKVVRNLIENIQRKAASRKKMAKVTALTLCAALALGETGSVMYASASDYKQIVQEAGQSGKGSSEGGENEADVKEENTGTTENTAAESVSGKTEDADADISKEETVYVLSGADGAVRKIIVSDWIKNVPGINRINDKTELTNLETVKDEMEYTAGTNNIKVWNAQGNDIYYQGDIEKELPVTMSITYMLDGKKISPEELAGKSGKVTIRFDYTNEQYEEVDIDGRKTRIYVPFAMMTGMILDDEVFTNVEVTNGRLVNDGSRTVVAGLAFPGLQENLNVDSDKMEIPDYVEITADVKEFELGMTATVATNDVFNGIQLDKEEALDELNGSMGDMTDAMDQLMDGSSQLYEGLCTLLDKSGELIEGIDKLASGSAELKSGAGTLDEGASKLQDGAARLQTGLNTLTSKNAELNGGARQVFDTLLSTAQTQLNAAGLEVPAMTVENYTDVLNQAIASLDETQVYQKALDQVTNAVEAQRAYIESQVTAVVKGEVVSKVEEAVRQQVTAKVTEAAQEQVSGEVTKAVRQQVTEQVEKAARAQVTAKVEEVVRQQVTEQVTAQVKGAGKAEITEKVTAAMREEIVQQVTQTVEDRVQEQVTVTVRDRITVQVIQDLTGMDREAYEAAVVDGTIGKEEIEAVESAVEERMQSEEGKAMLQAQVQEQMSSDQIKAEINSNVEKQMAGESVQAAIAAEVETQMQAVITAKVEEQMASDATKAAMNARIDGEMASDAVKATIASNIEKEMSGKTAQDAIAANVKEQMAGDKVKAMIDANVEEQMASDTVKAMLDENVSSQLQNDTLKNTIAENTELQVKKAISENMASEAVQGQLAAAAEGAKSVIALKASLDSYNAFYLGLQAYTAGVAEAASGADQLSAGIGELKGGTGKLYDGAAQLYDGIQTMKKSAPALTDGVKQLRDGALELSDGLGQFNEEGIQKLADAVDGDLDGLLNRLRAVSDVSKNYKSFAGIDDDMEGSVKFIYRTEAIEIGK